MKHTTIPNYFNNYSLEVGTTKAYEMPPEYEMVYLHHASGPNTFYFTMSVKEARAMAYALAVAADELEAGA